MNELVKIGETLPSLISRAATALASATTAAQVLEVQEAAAEIYDTAKRQARLAKAKGAHDEVISAVYRAQADALLIESRAKSRLADEYDAAQERGEVASQHDGRRAIGVPDGNAKPTAEDLGLTRKQIHEARQIRDAEQAQPGVVAQVLNARVDSGQEPSRAALREAVVEAAKQGLRGTTSPASKANPSYKPDPQWDAMLAVSAGCRSIMDRAGNLAPDYILGGFVDDAQKRRNLATIRECRDFLSTILEHSDAHF